MAKSAAFGVVHLGISFGIGWALTGSVAMAGAIMLVEPLANTVAHFFFDRWWARREAKKSERQGRGSVAPAWPRTPALASAGSMPRP